MPVDTNCRKFMNKNKFNKFVKRFHENRIQKTYEYEGEYKGHTGTVYAVVYYRDTKRLRALHDFPMIF